MKPARSNVFDADVAATLNVPRVSVYLTPSLNLAANAVTPVGWAGLTYDTDGMWSSTNNVYFTVRTAGLYLFLCQLQFDGIPGAVPAGTQRAFMFKGGTQVALTAVNPVQQVTVPTDIQVAATVPMNAGEQVNIFAQQSILANELLNAGAGTSFFTATFLSTI